MHLLRNGRHLRSNCAKSLQEDKNDDIESNYGSRGVIALVRATTSTAFQARTLSVAWKDAPRDVFFLRDELETCKAFLESIQEGIFKSSLLDDIETSHMSGGLGVLKTEALKALLTRAENIVVNLGQILGELVGRQGNSLNTCGKNGDPAIDRSQKRLAFRKKVLWIRRLDAVTKLRKMLRRATDDIALQLMMLNINIATINASYGARSASRDRIREDKGCIISRLVEPFEFSGSEIDMVKERLVVSAQQVSQHVHGRQLEAKESVSRSGFSQQTPASEARNYRVRQMGYTRTLDHTEYDRAQQRMTEGVLGHGRQTTAPGPFALPKVTRETSSSASAMAEDRNLCQNPVTGVTNSNWEFRWLQRVCGSLGITHTALKQRHTDALDLPPAGMCDYLKRRACGSVSVRYRFPIWLARAIISLYFTYHSGPELLIRVSRVVSTSDYSFPRSLIGRIRANDIVYVKKILRSCPSAINVVFEDGNSALSLAITYHRTDIARLLIRAGASPFRRDERGMTAALLVLFLFITARTTHDIERHIPIDLVSISRILEEDGFTELHKVVVGNICGTMDVETALANPTFRSQINNKTATGLTPLHLAAHCHNTTGSVVRQLLAAGADPNATTVGGGTPLTYACWSGNEETTRALLEAGSAPHFAARRCGSSYNLLYHAAEWSSNLVDVLLRPEHGLDINGADAHGMTALCYAALSNNAEVLSRLIARGADMDTISTRGETPLHETVMRSAHQSARVLLALGHQQPEVDEIARRRLEQRYRYVNDQRGWGICHYLAEVADAEMMQIGAELRMTGLPDLSMFKDIKGKTALDLFYERTGVYVIPGSYGPSPVDSDDQVEQQETTRLIRAWKNLLESINRDVREAEPAIAVHIQTEEEGDKEATAHGIGKYESDSDDEFFDAREG